MFRWLILTALAGIAPSELSAKNPERNGSNGVEAFKLDSWRTDAGAPLLVGELTQTPDGYLWMTGSGLTRFDGRSFEHIDPPRGSPLATSPPRTLFADRRGRLWIGFGDGGGVGFYSGGVIQTAAMPSPPPEVSAITGSKDGAIWAAFGGRGPNLFRLLNGRWQTMSAILGLPPGFIIGMVATQDGTLWLTIVNEAGAGTLVRLPLGARRAVIEPDVLGSTRLSLAPDGSLWVSDSHSTRIIRDRFGRRPPHVRAVPAISGIRAPRLAIDRRGGIWGASGSKPLFRIVDGHTRWPGSPSSIATGAFVDHEGTVWIGTEDGLERYRRVPVVRSRSVPVDRAGGLALAAGSSGTLFISSGEQLFSVREQGAPKRFSQSVSGESAICASNDGGIWVVTAGHIERMGGRNPTTLPVPPGGALSAFCVEDRKNRLWINSELKSKEVIWWHDRLGWHRAPERFSADGIWNMAKDPGGDLAIVSSTNRLLRVSGGGISEIPQQRLRIGALTMITDQPGQLFVGGRDGLVRIRGTRIQRISAADHPWLGRLRSLAIGRDGTTWMLAPIGLIRVATVDLERAFDRPHSQVRFRVFDDADGYEGGLQRVGFRGPQLGVGSDGRVWFLSRAGLMELDPRNLARNNVAPPLVVSSVSTPALALRDPPTTVNLAPGTTQLRIGFAANSLKVPARNRVVFRLDDQDSNWVEAGTRREADYTNLSPGTYVFRLAAANDDGVWAREKRVVISIPPTFVQSWPFRAFCALLLGGLLCLAYVVRLRVVAQRIRARLLDRLQERERIARDIHDTLLQSIQAVMLRFQIALDGLPENATARRDLERVLDQADEVIADGRDRLRDLRRTGGLEDIEGALREIAGRQLAGSGTTARVTSVGTERAVNPVVWAEIASIVAEVLFNVARHARATEVSVEISYRPTDLLLRIRDDGIGIDPMIARDGRKGHYGIPGMRERAAKVSARLTVLPHAADGGTEVTILVPAATSYAGLHENEASH